MTPVRVLTSTTKILYNTYTFDSFHHMTSKYLDVLPSNRYTFSLQSSRSGDWTCPSTVVGRIPVRRRKVRHTKKAKMHLLWKELVLSTRDPCGTTKKLRVKGRSRGFFMQIRWRAAPHWHVRSWSDSTAGRCAHRNAHSVFSLFQKAEHSAVISLAMKSAAF